MKKYRLMLLIAVAVIIVILGILIYRYNCVYNEKWVVGKHYTEIMDRYGDFDRGYPKPYYPGKTELDFPGTYCYQITPPGKNWLDLTSEEYLVIHFNENGIAYRAERKRGWYGG